MLHKVRDYVVHSWVMQSVSVHFLRWTWRGGCSSCGSLFLTQPIIFALTLIVVVHPRTCSTLPAAAPTVGVPKARAGAACFSCMADKRWKNWSIVVLEVLAL